MDLLKNGPRVANVGSEHFAGALRAQGAAVTHVDWRPPAGGNPALLDALERLRNRPEIAAANAEALERILTGHPVLVDVARALDVIPGMTRRTILHAGPPVTWERMCGPMRGAVIGALILEGLAVDEDEAARLAGSGEITFAPNHEHGAVGPMAGVTSASSSVFVVENRAFGNHAFCNINEGYGKVLRYGAYSSEVLDRLGWLNRGLGPALGDALRRAGGVDLRAVIAQALHMGDEVHNRNKAAGLLLLRALAPHMARAGHPPDELARMLEFIGTNEVFFVNLSMACAKAMLDAAHGIPHSTVVTTMSRNGTDFGIRVSGLPDRWFTGQAQYVKGLYFPGFSAADAARDMGDSVITETAGLGGFAMAAAPAIVQFVGGSVDMAYSFTLKMYEITLGESRHFTVPNLDFRGTPTGIDVRKVAETGLLPNINTGIAHKDPGVGQVGAGLVFPPKNCFEDALLALAEAAD